MAGVRGGGNLTGTESDVGLWAYTASDTPPVDIEVGGVAIGGPVPGAAPTTGAGVPVGTALTDVYPGGGILTVTTPGAVIEDQAIHGYLDVEAPGVIVRRTAILGPDRPLRMRLAPGLVTTGPDAAGLVIEDSTVAPTHPTLGLNGVHGSGFTLRRVDISRSIDGVMVTGDDVLVTASWIHALTGSSRDDPAHDEGPSHNDGVQIQGGRNIRVEDTTISGGSNSAVMLTQDVAPTGDVWIIGNRPDDGQCTVNISKKERPFMTGLHVDDNVFGGRTVHPDCGIVFNAAHSDLEPTGNTWATTGQPVSATPGQ